MEAAVLFVIISDQQLLSLDMVVKLILLFPQCGRFSLGIRDPAETLAVTDVVKRVSRQTNILYSYRKTAMREINKIQSKRCEHKFKQN